jgi:hypothetical protein
MRMLKDRSGVGDNFRIFRLVPRLQTQLVVEGLRLSLWAPSTKRPRRGEENLARCSREVRSPLDRQEENRKADQRRDSAAQGRSFDVTRQPSSLQSKYTHNDNHNWQTPKKGPAIMSLDGGALGVRHHGNKRRDSSFAQSWSVLVVLPGDRREYVAQHSVNRLELGRGKKSLGTIRVLHFELKHRYSKTLFGETFFEVVYFGMAQLGFEQALIPINVPLMDT